MKKGFIEGALMVAIAFALFLAGVFASAFIKSPPTNSGDWATWTGAFFTALAFIGTIYLATSETRRRERMADQVAMLAAKRMSIKIFAVRQDLTDVIADFEKAARLVQEATWFAVQGKRLLAFPLWNIDELLPFAHLENGFAQLLVVAAEKIITNGRALCATGGQGGMELSYVRLDAAVRMLEMLKDIEVDLLCAEDQCDAAVKALTAE
jgi:hypothetical protein